MRGNSCIAGRGVCKLARIGGGQLDTPLINKQR